MAELEKMMTNETTGGKPLPIYDSRATSTAVASPAHGAASDGRLYMTQDEMRGLHKSGAVEVLAKRLTAMGVTNFSFTPGSNPNATPEQIAGEISKALDQIESGTAASATDQGAAVKPWQERVADTYGAGLSERSQLDVGWNYAMAEITDLRAALAERAQAQPSGAKSALNKLLERIDDAHENYERMGEVCSFEGHPMIYASTLTEIIELRGEFHVASLATPAPEQEAAPSGAVADDFGQKVTALVGEIRTATSLAWRDSKVEELIELIDPSPAAATTSR